MSPGPNEGIYSFCPHILPTTFVFLVISVFFFFLIFTSFTHDKSPRLLPQTHHRPHHTRRVSCRRYTPVRVPSGVVHRQLTLSNPFFPVWSSISRDFLRDVNLKYNVPYPLVTLNITLNSKKFFFSASDVIRLSESPSVRRPSSGYPVVSPGPFFIDRWGLSHSRTPSCLLR